MGISPILKSFLLLTPILAVLSGTCYNFYSFPLGPSSHPCSRVFWLLPCNHIESLFLHLRSSSCSAFSQALTINLFRLRIWGKPHDLKRIDRDERHGEGKSPSTCCKNVHLTIFPRNKGSMAQCTLAFKVIYQIRNISIISPPPPPPSCNILVSTGAFSQFPKK